VHDNWLTTVSDPVDDLGISPPAVRQPLRLWISFSSTYALQEKKRCLQQAQFRSQFSGSDVREYSRPWPFTAEKPIKLYFLPSVEVNSGIAVELRSSFIINAQLPSRVHGDHTP
jgi:hypothetical protein